MSNIPDKDSPEVFHGKRREARAAGFKYYFTGKACKHGHFAVRVFPSGECVVCKKDAYMRNYWKNADRYRAYSRSRRKGMKEGSIPSDEYKDKMKNLSSKRHLIKHSPCNKYFLADIDIFKNVADSWNDDLGLVGRERTQKGWTVDHDIPLMHKSVAGLNAASNLNLIKASSNFFKGNTFFPHWVNHETGVVTIMEGYSIGKYKGLMEAGEILSIECTCCTQNL